MLCYNAKDVPAVVKHVAVVLPYYYYCSIEALLQKAAHIL
jgi:hypothetical protein